VARAEMRDGKSLAARKYARRDLLDGNLAKFGKCFAKLLEHQFSSFAKKNKDNKCNWQTIGDALILLLD
jgi:hypothetical protein